MLSFICKSYYKFSTAKIFYYNIGVYICDIRDLIIIRLTNTFLLLKFVLNHLKFQLYEYLPCTLWVSIDIPDTAQEKKH